MKRNRKKNNREEKRKNSFPFQVIENKSVAPARKRKKGEIPEQYKNGFTSAFYNVSNQSMTLDDVFEKVRFFMALDPRAEYKLMIGSDSQAKESKGYTTFVSSIIIQRVGKGSWLCNRDMIMPRVLREENIAEKISTEVSYTQELLIYFAERRKELEAIVEPFLKRGASFTMEGHIDVGNTKRNRTSIYAEEMINRIEAMGIKARIKPYSIAASWVANRKTK